MRKESTDAEGILWEELRAKKLGVKFRRQHLIDQFIVDFYCVELGLVVEVEGDIHKRQKEADKERERILRALGCDLIRISNKAIEEGVQKVIRSIKKQIRILSS